MGRDYCVLAARALQVDCALPAELQAARYDVAKWTGQLLAVNNEARMQGLGRCASELVAVRAVAMRMARGARGIASVAPGGSPMQGRYACLRTRSTVS